MRFGLQKATRRSARHHSRSARPKNRRSGLFGRRLSVETLEQRCLLSIGELPDLPGLHPIDLTPDDLRGQVVYLDFDGAENVTYNGPVVVENIDIPAFRPANALVGQEQTIIERTLEGVRRAFAGIGVRFVTEAPIDGQPRSTVYVGGDGKAFREYGLFLSVAENVDVGNANTSDNAFVFSDIVGEGAAGVEGFAADLARAITHEVGHLVGYAHDYSTDGGGPLGSVAASITDKITYTGSNVWKNITVDPGTTVTFIVDGIFSAWPFDHFDTRWYDSGTYKETLLSGYKSNNANWLQLGVSSFW